MKLKNNVFLLLTLLILLTFTGCKANNDALKDKVILGGGNFSEPILNMIKEGLESKGYSVEMMIFDGNHLAATACMEGDISAFIFNHKPWIEKFNKEHDSNLLTMEPYIFYSRTAMYSLNYESLDSLPNGAKIAIPGDPTNLELSLLLLEENKLIELNEKSGEFYSLMDIKENFKNIELIETEITQTMGSIKDVDAVVVNAKNALDYGLDAKNFLVENMLKKDYPVGIVIDDNSKDEKWVKDAIDITQTKEFKDKFDEIYKGTLVLY